MRPRGRQGCQGQLLVEHLLIAMALIAVVVALTPRINAAAQRVMGRAQAQLVNPSATADAIIPKL